MFSVDDFLNILQYLQGDTSIILDPKTSTVAKDEQGKSISYLNNILIPAFNTPDTVRLFNFFIDWYAANKTIISTSRDASDVYSLPSSHIDELFASFGFDNRNALQNLYPDVKPEFFKDLVELYKIKGTPSALYKVLSYFEVDLIALYEYYLYKNTSGELVFRRQEIYRSLKFADIGSLTDIKFADIIDYDPHWLLTQDQINQSIARNGYGLPSKTPYIGIVPSINFNQFIPYLAYISRYSQDKYYAGDTTTRDIVTSLNITVSYIELYVGTVYAFLKEFPIGAKPPLYVSDFSTDTDNWGGVHSAVVGDVDAIGGLDDWMQITCDNTYDQHYAAFAGTHGHNKRTYSVSFKYYIPSGQSHVSNVRFFIDGGFAFIDGGSVVGAVGEVNATITSHHTGTFIIMGLSSTTDYFVGDNNILYVKDIVITEVDNFICYDGTGTYTLDSVTTEYNSFVGVKPDRSVRNDTIDLLYDQFTRLENIDFINIEGGSGAYLSRLNNSFKEEIDIYFEGNRGDECVSYLISDLGNYYKANIDKSYSPLGMFILDFGAFQKQFINDVINFFKPYHARMQFSEKFISIGNKLEESIYTDDEFDYPIYEININDFCTGDGHPSFYDDTHPTDNYYSREHYDSTAYFDSGALFDNLNLSMDIEMTVNDRLNYYPSDSTNSIENEYILDILGNVMFASSNSVGVYLDRGWTSDVPFINDLFTVTVEAVEPVPPIPPVDLDTLFFQWRMETDGGADIVFNNSPSHDFLSSSVGTIGTVTNSASVDTTTPMVGLSALRNEIVGWGNSVGLTTDNFLKNNVKFASGFRIGFWLKQPSGTGGAEAHIITDGSGFDIYRNATYIFNLIVHCGNVVVISDVLEGITESSWNFYEISIDPSSYTYHTYVNGVLNKQGAMLNPLVSPTGDNLYFGNLFGNPAESYLDNIMMSFDVTENLYTRAYDIFYRDDRPPDDIKVWWRGDSQTGVVANTIDDYVNSPLVYSTGLTMNTASETSIVKVGSGSIKLLYNTSIRTNTFKPDYFYNGKMGFWAYFPSLAGVLEIGLCGGAWNFGNYLVIGYWPEYGLVIEIVHTEGGSSSNQARLGATMSLNAWHFFEWEWSNIGPVYQRIRMDNEIVELNYPYGTRAENEAMDTSVYMSSTMDAVNMYNTQTAVYVDNLMITNDVTRDLWSIKNNPTFP